MVPMSSRSSPKSNTNMADHSLRDMIERFVVVDTFLWRTSSQVLPMNLNLADYRASTPKYLKSYILPQALLDKSVLLREKLNNFMLMRADIEIDIKVNATPFQQGALAMVYDPRVLNTSKFRGEGSEFLASVTSLPHRVMYLEKTNAMTFEVPYANIVDYINLTDTDSTFGVLNIYAFSPLRGISGEEQVDVTVRARFKNLELKVPTDNSLNSQLKYREMARRALDPPVYSENLGLTAQSLEGEKIGPVTRIAGAIATIGGALSGVPVIGNAAAMVGWFARGVGNVATAFGWSKPIDLIMPVAMYARPAAYMGNTEGKDASVMLAQIADNAIDPSDMIPSGLDEMALSFIFARPNTIGRITVPKPVFLQEDILFSWEVAPFNYMSAQLDSNGQDFCLGSFSFASLMYKLWRGSIEYSLTAVKTQYHSARVMAVYFPNRTRSEIPAKYGEAMTTNSNVLFDLTANAEDEFSLTRPIVIPYTSEEPWKQTLHKDIDGNYVANTMKTSIGTVAVYCINELVCPDTVAQEVTFLLQVKAGPDYEVAVPQIQIQGGFANVVPPNIEPELIGLINTQFVGDCLLQSASIGSNPEITQSGNTVIQQASFGSAVWVKLDGKTFSVPDGTYYVTLVLSIQQNELYLQPGLKNFTVIVRDGLVDTISCEYLTNLIATNGTQSVNFSVASPSHLMIGQMDEGAVLPTPTDTVVAERSPSLDLTRCTTGEYCKSLRPLTKRFVHTRDLTDTVALTPADFNNYDPAGTPSGSVGQRSWADTSGQGGFLPESWLNLVSYLYRFSAGSVRSKIFVPWDVRTTTSLHITDDLRADFNTLESDPAFVQAGVLNNAVETTIPYYGQYRARTVGDQVRGQSAIQRFAPSEPGVYPYYEAAGDDFTFWFLIGPPVMRPIDVIPVTIPVITEPA